MTRRKQIIPYKKFLYFLPLPPHCISENCIKRKINVNFCFHTSLWFIKRIYEGLKAFIKPFEAPQRSAKVKIYVNFLSLSGIWRGRINTNVTNYKKGVEHNHKNVKERKLLNPCKEHVNMITVIT